MYIQGVKKLRLQRLRDDRGGKNKHVFLFDKTLDYAPFFRKKDLRQDGLTSVTTRTD